MIPLTLFNGSLVVVDTMILINFHGLLVLDSLIRWAKGERDEFKKKCPNQICTHLWEIVDKANDLGFIGEQEAIDLKEGLYYV
ncbi:MAG: hypothetical protein M1371_02620 [Actinobacteria bacterium]|nr:hypothetical protein [Actinomycetota bacterium]